jgi:trimeric autotransporter adhesin
MAITGSITTRQTISGASVTAGGGTLNATTFNARSDARLKENLQPYECEASVLDLPVYKYDFKDSGLKDQIGCLAQDLQKICPEIVSEGEGGYLSIQESKIVFLLLQELKKQSARISELEKKATIKE